MGKASVKVEGGKMVNVEVENSEVSVTGDFFIEPPEARRRIEEALTELNEGADKEDAVEELEEIEAKFIGFSAKDVAEAFERAKKDRWRIINEGEYTEAMHHAIDEVLTEKMNNGEIQPTLRFWHRKNPSVPFGRFQSLEDEIEVDYADEKGIEIVRRITGGGAMFAEPGNVITYSLYLPEKKVSENIEESYQELDKFAVESLKELGINASYQPLNDIEDEKGKLGGAAQLRKDKAVLHHTTMSYDLDTEEMLRVLRIGKEKVSDKAIKSAEKRVSRISDHTDHGRKKVIEKMIEEFSKGRNIEEDSLNDSEIQKARELAEEKFSSEEWLKKL